jgi:hypothetical protein
MPKVRWECVLRRAIRFRMYWSEASVSPRRPMRTPRSRLDGRVEAHQVEEPLQDVDRRVHSLRVGGPDAAPW